MLVAPADLPTQLVPLLNTTNGLKPLSGARKPKKYHVLGDASEFAAKLAASIPAPPPPEPDTVDRVDPAEFPEDIWAAASSSPDRGAAVIAAYREVHKAREQYQAQLDMIYNARTLQDATAISGRGAFEQPPGSLFTGRATITQAVGMTKEPRKLDLFDKQQRTWNGVTTTLMTQTNRPPNDLTLNRGAEWRQRNEKLNMLERVVPMDERGRGGPEQWNLALRNAWEHPVAVGGTNGRAFGGLWTTMKDKPPALQKKDVLRIGKPDLDDPTYFGATASGTASGSKPTATAGLRPAGPGQSISSVSQSVGGTMPGMSGDTAAAAALLPDAMHCKPRSLVSRERTWAHGQYLADKSKGFDKSLRALVGNHEVDFKGLGVRGEPLEAQLLQLAYAPITLSEVEGHMATHAPKAFQAYAAVKQQLAADAEAAAAAEQARLDAEAAAIAAAGPQPGPHAELSTPYVLLAAVAGEGASSSFSLRHRGTAAFQYEWRRHPTVRPPGAAEEPAGGTERQFYLAQQRGTLLPGQVAEFSFTFQSSRPGTFAEEWSLHTKPVLLSGTLHLNVRGMARAEDLTVVPRRALVAVLAQREKMTKVNAALQRILHNVQLPSRQAPPDPAPEAAEADAFFAGSSAEWPPVYYSPSMYSRLREVYSAAHGELVVLQAPPPEDPKETKKKEKKEKKGAPPPPPIIEPPKFPDAWDGHLTSLDALLADLAPLAPDSCAKYMAQVAAERQAARVPQAARRVLQHAMRALVLRAVDAVDVKLAAVREDYFSRLEEQGGGPAASAAAAATGAAAAAAAPPAAAAAAAAAAAGKRTSATDPGMLLSAAAVGALAKDSSTVASLLIHGKPGGVPRLALSGNPSVNGSRPSSSYRQGGDGGLGATAPPGGLVDDEWYRSKCKSAAKVILRQAVGTLSDEVERENIAVGDTLEMQLQELEAKLAAAAADGGSGEQDGISEGLLWERFALLRRWVQLGVPPRGDIR